MEHLQEQPATLRACTRILLAPTRGATTFRARILLAPTRGATTFRARILLAPTRGATTFRERALARNVVVTCHPARLPLVGKEVRGTSIQVEHAQGVFLR